MPQPLLLAKNIIVRLRTSLFFENTSWQINQGEHWLIVGPNGAGKTTFVKALAGLVPLKFGEIVARGKVSYVSFDTEQLFLEKEERKKDFESIVGKEKKGKTVRAFLGRNLNEDLVEEFSIYQLLSHEISKLSSGEMRKVFLVKTLLAKPKLLVLDEPFNGLDKKSRQQFVRFLDKIASNLQIILVTHHLEEIPKAMTHVMVIENGKIMKKFTKAEFQDMSAPTPIWDQFYKKSIFKNRVQTKSGDKESIIQMNDVSVTYGNKQILSHITWTVKKGENWAVLGPNGAGKSTLVKLITGDSLQVHANDVRIFGKRRDELSLWDLRKHLGYVSSETHVREKGLQHLSQGQKRMVLIEREIKRSPKLLILDEPCQHLGLRNRMLVLELIDSVGRSGKTNILLITHHEDEIVSSISHVLRLEKGKVVVVQ
jgi:molybdate transport system ATP-binding protein